MHLLGHERWAVRYLAAETLGRLGPPARAAVPALERLASGDDVELAQSARDALLRMR
jgi:hypothetical protein